MTHVSCGGVTHWALAPDEDDSVMTIAWGQNAANGNRSFYLNTLGTHARLTGELGLGPEEPRSATKPTRNQPLIGIEIYEWVHVSLFFFSIHFPVLSLEWDILGILPSV